MKYKFKCINIHNEWKEYCTIFKPKLFKIYTWKLCSYYSLNIIILGFNITFSYEIKN
jgi:hypothetical protein